MNLIKHYIKKLRLIGYNKKYNTKIHSTKANLNAKYAKGVLISNETTVTRDVTIGEYSYVNSNSYIENCNIGKFCSISSGVYICPFEHDNSLLTTHPIVRLNEKQMTRKKVEIGNDVLISLNAIILEGVCIGDGAVIGAGAIVTKDVKPYEIVGGVPAKHIRFRFDEEKIHRLQELKWWDWDINTIEKNIEFLENGN